MPIFEQKLKNLFQSGFCLIDDCDHSDGESGGELTFETSKGNSEDNNLNGCGEDQQVSDVVLEDTGLGADKSNTDNGLTESVVVCHVRPKTSTNFQTHLLLILVNHTVSTQDSDH